MPKSTTAPVKPTYPAVSEISAINYRNLSRYFWNLSLYYAQTGEYTKQEDALADYVTNAVSYMGSWKRN